MFRLSVRGVPRRGQVCNTSIVEVLRTIFQRQQGMKVALASVVFAEAARIWLESRQPYLSEAAYTRYQFYVRPLTVFFAEQRLNEITPDLIRAYQKARQGQGVSATVINHECSCLQQMLKRVGRWADISADYDPLPLPKAECGRALTDAEYIRLFRMASSNKAWTAAFLFMTIAINTSCGPGEIKALKVMDVDVEKQLLNVPVEGAKNPERQRTLPLNQYALAAVKAALERAKQLGASQPWHYLFPYGAKGRIDPTKHQTTFKTAWKGLCAAADIRNFRMYDLRHHAITTLLENPAISDETAESIAGHISARMKKRYSHIRIEAKRAALDALMPPWKDKKSS